MTWRELSDFLHSQRRSFVPRAVSDFAQIGERPLDTVKRLESTTCDSLNEILRGFAATKTWPQLSDEQTLILYYRLSFGVVLAVALSRCTTRLFSGSENQDSHMIQWALNDAWDHPGLSHMLRVFSERHRFQDEVQN